MADERRREPQDPGARSARREARSRVWVIAGTASALGLGSLMAFLGVREDERQVSWRRFHDVAGDLALHLEERLARVTDVVRGARGFYEGSQSVEREEWRSYVAAHEFAGRLSSLVAMTLVVAAEPTDVEGLQEKAQAEGETSFRVHGAGERELRVVYFSQAPLGDSPLLGLDVGTLPAVRWALDTACAVDEPTASAPIRLAALGDTLLLAVAECVLRGREVARTAQERRARASGWVVVFLDLEELIGKDVAVPSDRVHVEVLDVEPGLEPRRLFDEAAREEPGAQAHRWDRSLSVYGRTWSLRFSGPVEIEGRATMVGILGFVVTVLVTALLLTYARSARLATDRATVLARSEAAAQRHVVEVDTARREIERQAEHLAAARDAAQAANRAKDDFLRVVSHELRTPLNGVLGMASLVLASQLGADQRQNVETIRDSGEGLLRIVEDLLDFAAIQAGHFRLDRVPFDLRHCCEEVVRLLGPEAAAKGLDLVLRYPTDAARRFVGDPARLRQVLLGIVGNAVKFTPTGHVVVEVAVPRVADGIVRVAVKDTGPGIPAEVVPRLFQRFVQADSSTTRRHGGLGLGLSIARGLVEGMGGRIGVESRPGQGSTFWFEVPLLRAGLPGTPDTTATGLPSPRPSSTDSSGLGPVRRRVLLAEDNRVNALVAVRMLETLGCSVDLVVNGIDAVARATAKPYDLVLMDCQMPEMDGYAATETIRRVATRRMPIVALTANATAEDRARCLRAGMDDLVAKPLTLGELKRVLEAYAPQRPPEPSV